MLAALADRNDKKKIYATNASASNTYYCPNCKERVIPHLGRKVVHHYKHKPGCSCQYQGEKREHMQAKYAVYDALKQRGLNVEMEKFVQTLCPEGNRYADIYVKSPTGVKVAIELQYSNITEGNILKRTIAYKNANTCVLWVQIAPKRITDKLESRQKNCFVSKLSPTPLMRWLDVVRPTAWLYEPISSTFWNFELTKHQLYKTDREGFEYPYSSKRWVDTSFTGPFDVTDLLIHPSFNIKYEDKQYHLAEFNEKSIL
ncbi:competence protein CoiA [Maridesulfovibrio sp.]|uniref:competence protein CoiA n=1 Tax=Maridesulfovibrio sp. TaxID=2795000 RepID=UPI003BAC802B